MSTLDGKVALVTGGASGIGKATAERLHAEGAHVVVADVDESGARKVADSVSGEFVRLDVADSDQWMRVTEELRASHGGCDIAHLNAGITTLPASEHEVFEPFDLATMSDDAYRHIMGINVDGVVYGARAVLPLMDARGGGAIVATASVAGLIGFAPDPIYTLTKHAVVGLVRALAPLLSARGVRIHAVCPGVVDTNILGPGGGARAREAGFPVMPASQIGDAVFRLVTSTETGQLCVCLPDRDHTPYEFAPIPGIEALGPS